MYKRQGDASEEPHDLAEDLGGILKIDRLLVVGSDQVPCGDALPALLPSHPTKERPPGSLREEFIYRLI